MRTRLTARIAERLDRQAQAADREAVGRGLVAVCTGRWSRTYRDPRFAQLRAAREAGCFHAPACRIAAGLPDCLASAARLREAA